MTQEQIDRRENEAIDRRIAIVRGLVHEALASGPEMIARRAAIARTHADSTSLARVDGAIRGRAVSDELAAVAPAVVALASLRDSTLRAVVARVAERRLVSTDVTGSRWAYATGCGVSFAGSEQIAAPCGMGHVPARSRRLLYWYTQ
jgi:hypothetical protein